MIWFSCFVVCLCIFVFWFSCCCWFSFVLQEQHVLSHISLLANKEIRRQHLYRFNPKSTKSTIIQMQKTLQTICRACQMRKGYDNPGRVSFQLGLCFLCHAQIERDWLRPSTPCATVLIIQQLLPTYMHHHELKLDSNKDNLTAERHRLDNLPVPSMPWRPCTDLCFFQLNINYRQIKSAQLTAYTNKKDVSIFRFRLFKTAVLNCNTSSQHCRLIFIIVRH